MALESHLVEPASPLWTEHLKTVQYDVYHLPEYCELCGQFEKAEPLAFIASEGGNVYFLPLLVRPIVIDGMSTAELRDVASPYGYAGPVVSPNAPADFIERSVTRFIETLSEHAIVTAFVRFHPVLTQASGRYQELGQLCDHGETVLIDLNQTEDQMWGQVRSNHRLNINRSRRKGYSTIIDDWSYLDAFYEMYIDTMKRVSAGNYYHFPFEYFTTLRRELADHTRLCSVLIDGQIAGAGLFFESNGIVQYHLSGTHTEFVKRHPSKVMLDDVRRWSTQRGNQVFHLGGGVGSQDDSLFRFKAGFSKERRRFSSWRVVVDRLRYDELVTGASKETSGENSYFPAYRTG